MNYSMKKVFVSGCFDMLHSNHIAFLNEASVYGDVYVALGSDKTIKELKGRDTTCSELERKYVIENLKSVTKCVISKGSGILDFLIELDEIKPDIFVVKEDGNTPEKKALCKKKNIEYIVLKTEQRKNLPERRTANLRGVNDFPYRIDIAGTWIDQPYVSKYCSGSAIVVSIEPNIDFFNRSGMATSTRNVAHEIWPNGITNSSSKKSAKILFRYDNPPGKKEISGSQDSLGIMLPEINKLYYEKGEYWPSKIDSIYGEDILQWLENHIYLLPLWPRPQNFNVLKNTNINKKNVKALINSTEGCWNTLKNKDLNKFAAYFALSFQAQIEMFPQMMNNKIQKVIDQYKDIVLSWKLSGAGGGGYLIFISEKPIDETIKIKIRRK